MREDEKARKDGKCNYKPQTLNPQLGNMGNEITNPKP
jgi:hypothetical protein